MLATIIIVGRKGDNKMPAKEEMFQTYEETIAQIDKQAYEAREKARATLREQLKTLQKGYHAELKAIRAIEQKTKRSKSNAG